MVNLDFFLICFVCQMLIELLQRGGAGNRNTLEILIPEQRNKFLVYSDYLLVANVNISTNYLTFSQTYQTNWKFFSHQFPRMRA